MLKLGGFKSVIATLSESTFWSIASAGSTGAVSIQGQGRVSAAGRGKLVKTLAQAIKAPKVTGLFISLSSLSLSWFGGLTHKRRSSA